MVSSVRSLPNHYETLGLAPDASREKIAEAFAAKMGLVGAQPVGAAARACVAYETLRDPARRRAYDRSIGLVPRPQPRQWSVAAPQAHWPAFVPSPIPPSPAAKAKAEPAPERPARVSADAPREAPTEVRIASIAASLRELAGEAAIDRPPPASAQARATAAFTIEPEIRELLAERRADDEAGEVDGGAFNWKRPVLAVAGLVATAGLAGALMGLWVRDGADPAEAESALTVKIPAAAKAHSAPAAPAAQAVEAVPLLPAEIPAQRRVLREKAAIAAEPAPELAETSASQAAAPDSGFIDSVTAQLAAEAPSPEPTAAAFPLPDRVAARTIERIGYDCGSVASTAAVDGAPGVFKVTCSSGQAYRAAPVHGRYHFRRWGGR